jgi:TonB family protein
MRVVDSISVVFLLVALGVNAALADTAPQASTAPLFIDVKSPPPDITPPKWDASPHATPVYPKTARLHAEEGTANITITIREDGSVADPSVTTSTTFADLDEAALEAVKTWRYNPATKDGKPIAVRVGVFVKFSLGNGGGLPFEAPYTPYGISETDFTADGLATILKEGKVALSLLVLEDGTIGDVTIVQSSGDPALDTKEVERARKGHFEPKMQDGKPVKYHMYTALK